MTDNVKCFSGQEKYVFLKFVTKEFLNIMLDQIYVGFRKHIKRIKINLMLTNLFFLILP